MTRSTYFNSPFLLGFEHLERLLERTAKSAGDAYPPYNIEESSDDRLRITLAVVGFDRSELSVTVEDNQLVRPGQILVRLDPRDYQAALDHAFGEVPALHAQAERDMFGDTKSLAYRAPRLLDVGQRLQPAWRPLD